MGVGFVLTGTFSGEAAGLSSLDWLEQAGAWLESHEEEPLMLCRLSQGENEEPILFVQIHPCAEDVEFSVPEPNVCLVVAKTSTVGPGYHIFLCDLLRAFGKQMNIDWDEPDEEADIGDETGYFHTNEEAGVRREMVRWLSALSRVVVENCRDDGVGIRMVSMPIDYSYPDEKDILTPIGSRTTEWFEQMVETPERGLDFFPWWPEGVGAAFFLGRALCRLWQEIRWRAPITDEEGALLMDVHLDLERAYHLDPSANIPWREWHELIAYLNEYFGYAEFQHEDDLETEIERQAAAADRTERLIGYRRGRVQVTLTGGWSLTIPGNFAEQWEENGETWSAWHGGRTIWFTSWSVKVEGDEKLSPREILDSRPWPDEGQAFEHEDGELAGRAMFLRSDQEGKAMWNLRAYSAVEGNFALCNIYVHDESDLPWALEVWKSMRT